MPVPPPAAAKPAAPAEPQEEIQVSPELLADFVVEAEEHLETIERNLLTLEENPTDAESINEVFRATHSIKGTASYVNLGKINALSHKMETCFDRIRKGTGHYSNEMADVILKGLDLLKSMIAMIKMKESPDFFDIEEVLTQLEPYTQAKEAPPAKAAAPAQSDVDIQFKAFLNLATQQVISLKALGQELIDGKLTTDDLMVLNRSIKTLHNGASKIRLNAVSELTERMEALTVQLLAEETTLAEAGPQFQAALNQLVQVVQLAQSGSSPTASATTAAAPAAVPAAPQPAVSAALPAAPKPAPKPKESAAEAAPKEVKQQDEELKTMRIDAFRLDAFMNLIGELIIARNSLNHLLGEVPHNALPSELIASLRQAEGAFNRISEDLQSTLMEMRLIAVKTVFQKIPRIIRDISRKTNKVINLQVIGENTQIDKSIIEVLGDPLVHIIRNSCDHGIETKEARLAKGKPEAGNIILKAQPQGSSIVIEIIDDGAGINTKRVLEKAIEKGLVRPELADKLDAKTINQFVFAPGFSTAAVVSDISGRGVGMDVVMTNIQKIHGTVEVDSEPDQGTRIRLILPLTLSVIDALLVVENKQKFAIPLEMVKESIEIRVGDLHQLKNKEALNLRGDIIGVSRLSRLLDLNKEHKPDDVVSVVVLQVGTRVMGLVVDDLTNQQEIVVKPLQQYLSRIPGISGSTIMGNGDIVLILEPSELIDLSTQ